MSDAAAADLALLEQWRAGDAKSGKALFERHFSSVYGFFETKCPAEADELVESTFFAGVKARDQFRGIELPRGMHPCRNVAVARGTRCACAQQPATARVCGDSTSGGGSLFGAKAERQIAQA